MPIEQAPKETWTQFNHLFHEGVHTSYGYAVCVNCQAHENQAAITKMCPNGPVGNEIKSLNTSRDRVIQALVEDVRERLLRLTGGE